MADTNPHNIGTDKVIVSLNALQRYHHQLLEALGLVHDTGAYQYKGNRKDAEGNPEFTATSISAAIDSIYDLAKSGGVTFAAGYNEDATLDDVEFTADDVDTGNLYYINAQVGDDIVNIKLDASQFVKDSVLESVILLNVEIGTTTTTYKVNGKVASLDDEAGTLTVSDTDNKTKIYHVDGSEVNDLETGTYFYYTWKVDNGEASAEDAEDAKDAIEYYQFTCISLKDVYGDISGDDTYITYDKATATISANTGKVGTKDVTTTTEYSVEVVPASATAAGSVTVTPTVQEGQEASPVTYAIPAGSTAEAVLRDKGYIVPEGSGDTITSATTSSTTKEWIDVDADGNEVTDAPDALATTDNVKEVASTLQSQIDTLKAGTLTPGEITLDDTIDASEIEVANNKINIKIAVASGDEISALFGACVPANDAESIAATSEVNGGEPITTPGEYTINVGEQPEGSETDITWTRQD